MNNERTNEMTDEQNTVTLTDGCPNKEQLRCERCQSIILLPEKAIYKKQECFLPHMKKKSEETASEGETIQDFWFVDDMFTFENVGFTKVHEGKKYLICADCEIGPIGYQNVDDSKAFYVAISRVKAG